MNSHFYKKSFSTSQKNTKSGSKKSSSSYCLIPHDDLSGTGYPSVLYRSSLKTPCGSMLVIADTKALYFLEFTDHPKIDKRISKLQQITQSTIIQGESEPIRSIAQELSLYFTHSLQSFKTPYLLIGTVFQKAVWQALQEIPYGTTVSYRSVASSLSNASAVRAAANATGANRLALIIPCHRVIASNDSLGGYGSGISRKQWLLEHEQQPLPRL